MEPHVIGPVLVEAQALESLVRTLREQSEQHESAACAAAAQGAYFVRGWESGNAAALRHAADALAALIAREAS